MNVVVQYMLHRHPELADAPTAIDIARTDEQRAVLRAVASASEIGKFILTTPGVPTERVTALRRAFDAMTRIPNTWRMRGRCASRRCRCLERSCSRSSRACRTSRRT